MLDAQQLSDRIEIADLVTAYTRAIDTGDWGSYYHHRMVRTPAGWRSKELVEETVWTR